MDRVRRFVSGIGSSTVRNEKTGTAKDYDDVQRQIGVTVHTSPESLRMADAEFSQYKDLSGRFMSEVAREYWDDPEKQRAEIAELKRRHGVKHT